MNRFAALALAFLVLLGIAAVLLRSAQSDPSTNPAPSNTGPSGTHLLARALERAGFRVTETGSDALVPAPGRVYVVFLPSDEVPTLGSSEDATPAARSLRRGLRDGARVVTLPFVADIGDTLRDAKTLTVKGYEGSAELTSTGRITYLQAAGPIPPESPRTDVWTLKGEYVEEPFVAIGSVERGLVAAYTDGAGLMNRFLDQGDNATAFVQLLRAMGAEEVVFWNTAFAPTRPGFLAAIHPALQGAWYQLALLGLVVAYTWGRRFGYPERAMAGELGTRDLLVSVAESARRMRAADFAGRHALRLAEARLRHDRRFGHDPERWPASIREAFRAAQAAVEGPDASDEACLAALSRLDAALAAEGVR